MSADSPRRHPSGVGGAGGIGLLGGGGGGHRIGGNSGMPVPAVVPPQTVSDRSILDSAIGFINDVTLAAHQPQQDPKDTITWARFETCADVSDPRFGDDWELEGNAAPPLLLILGYGLGVQVWAIPANGEAVEVLSWRHGVVTALRVLPTPTASSSLDENGRADEPVDSFAEKRPLVALVDGGSAPSLVHGAGAAGSGGLGGVGLAGSGSSNPLGVGGGNQFSAVNFVSLKTGVQVKTIKFKNAVLDIQANRSAVAITFHERIAVFDARTLEDRLTITTCYPSPGINPNPIALGPRWLAYAENKLLHSKRSGGGCDGEGVPSYTATVLNAAKSFGKGLRELGEQVAAGLTGGSSGNGANAGSGTSSKSGSFDSASGGAGDFRQSGVVTIIDVKHPIKDYSPTTGTPLSSLGGHCGAGASDPIVAHFIAHSEALVAMEFDSSGMLLLTADRRGHDFHVFRIQPHPVGSSLAAVHHLYVLHRGDTSAKVQHIAFSLDSRWAAVSTLRGTTHVFPITPYGGAMGVRTHTSLHVVNKLSRFHRSAGLGADGRSSSPISHSESTTFVQSLQPYHNPTLPPFPRPTVVQPLAQLRQPFSLGSPPGSGSGVAGMMGGDGCAGGGGHHGHSNSSHRQRQRLSSLSDDSGKPLSVCSIFAKSRSWLLEPPTATREAPHRIQRKAVDSLFVMAGHGALIQYDLDTKLASNVAKEKICDDTPIELEVEARAQWNLGRRKDGSHEIVPPLAMDNWLIKDRHHASLLMDSLANQFDEPDERAESWLAQVEIITHAGPHRRLWMGPQFVFKNYNTPSGSNLNHVDTEAVEIGVTKTSTTTLPSTAAGGASSGLLAPVSSTSSSTVAHSERSSPLNMPLSGVGGGGGAGGAANASNVTTVAGSAVSGRSGVPVLIESGSYSSIEQSPKLMDRFRHGHLDSDYGHGDMRLKEDLADAMRESPSTAAARRETTGQMPVTMTATMTTTATATATATTTTSTTMTMTMTTSTTTLSKSEAISSPAAASTDNVCYYDALTEYDDHEDLEDSTNLASADDGQSNDDYQMEDYHFQQQQQQQQHLSKVKGSPHFSSTLASVLPNICSFEQQQQQQHQPTKIEKIVNPLGTVTDVNAGLKGDLQTDILDKVVCQLANEETVIHENCDEALFRPVVAIFCDDLKEQRKHEKQLEEEKALAEGDNQRRGDNALIKGGNRGKQQPPVVLANKLIVPVIAKEVDEVLVQKEKQQQQKSHKSQQRNQTQAAAAAATATAASVAMAGEDLAQALKFAELSHLNKPQKTAERIIKKDNEKQQQQMPEVLENIDDSVIASPAPATSEVVVKEVKKKEEKMESSALLASKTSMKKSKAKSKSNQKDIKKISLIDVDKEEKVNINKNDKDDDKVLVVEAKSLDTKEQPPKQDTEKQSKNKKVDLNSETDFDLELDSEDYADNLLANKTNIAALMISSATAQGLNLQVETTSNSKADEEEDESDNRELGEGSARQKDRKRDFQIDLKAKSVDKPIEAAAKAVTKDDDTMKTYKVKVIEEDVKKSSPSKTASSSSSPWRQSIAPKNSIQSNEDYPSLAPTTTTKKLPGKSDNFHDFLKTLPPLPALEPLEMGGMEDLELNVDDISSSPAPSSSPAGAAEAITPPPGSGSALSLINFESPLQEQKESLSRKITPPPRGFTEQNLIFALCGSLHYENEQQLIEAAAGSNLSSHTNSNSNSNSNSNTNTNTNSYTHSNTSSGSEEIILMEESISSNKKLSKKQKRKQQKAEAKAAVEAEDQAEDEELRPLISISMCDSQMEMSTKIKDHVRDGNDDDDDDGDDENVKHERNLNQSLPEDLLHFGSSGVALPSATSINTTTITTRTTTTASSSSIINPNATTTEDSEDPLPATTSDDNLIFSLSSSNHHHNSTPHKLKTKKLEHKINLIAAIEAATSSSTSSAEESSVETSSNPVNSLADILPSVLSSLPASSSTSSLCTAQTQATHLNTSSTASGGSGGVSVGLGGMPLGGGIGSVGVSMGMAGQTSATKKKTKRRKR